jgi:uncharacterized protein YjiS (DUF1127 family)
MQNSSAEQRSAFFATIAKWWRNWTGNRAGVAELKAFDHQELQRMAQDVGVNPRELRVLAGKWPESADLLSRRLSALELDASEIERLQSCVSNDLKKLCSLCVSKGRCDYDLDTHPNNSVWRDYCPNATTLMALTTQRSAQRKKVDER